MSDLLIATGNAGKLEEIQAILEEIPVNLVLPSRIGLSLNVVEDGQTYAENAARKAVAYAQAAKMIALADDSGLEVDALGGEPGLHSARYAPDPHATDADRRRLLVQNLSGKPRPWTAHFHCTVAIATPSGELYFAEGNCNGEILPVERGAHGFGYDPIFYIPELGKTMSELTLAEKNRISHRARAVLAAIPILQELLVM
ncbi:MAG: RdgB/HAM1 family non-canonical purine NTP pyrophosphatase [Chloroflexi bacterium]|nr:RdgB/HAM1 family non-canonical purine NTP pyrophosphatase [Chloroflexota bacterium]